jgi:hypothetical protein
VEQMRSDWFVEMLRSWKLPADVTRAELVQCSRLLKAIAISAGGRVVLDEEPMHPEQVKRFAARRATFALDRYAKGKHDAASFLDVAAKHYEPGNLLYQLKHALDYTRNGQKQADRFFRDTLMDEFMDWRSAEEAGARFIEKSCSIDELTVLQGSEYISAASELLAEAQKEVVISVSILLWDGSATHPATLLVDGLRSAIQRGVIVKVFSDQSRNHPLGDSRLQRRFSETLERLRGIGVQVIDTTADRSLHAKVIAVDRRAVIMGSHNWSGASLAGHSELSICFVAPELAGRIVRRLEDLTFHCMPTQ